MPLETVYAICEQQRHTSAKYLYTHQPNTYTHISQIPIHTLAIEEISGHLLVSVAEQAGLSLT